MPGFGRFTQINLGDLQFLEENPDVLNREAARFGLELAAVAYDFDVSRWMNAGWTDITIQADEKLLGGVAQRERADRPLYQRVKNEWIPAMARRHIRSGHRLRQVRGILWKPAQQEEDPQTGKAITMIHALPHGRFAVAIGFMGTGRRQVDWLSNLRFGHDNGFHAGFWDLQQQYEENADRITFEQTAKLLNASSLTLREIILEAGKPDSRFTLFAAGHSQGAAILQLWVYRLLQLGVQRQHILGYGYAPPSVAAFAMGDMTDYPLHLISSADDLVCRVGLNRHIGRNHLYTPDDAFRALCYQGKHEDPLFMQVLERTLGLAATLDSMTFLISYLEALKLLAPGETQNAIGVFVGGGVKEMVLRRTGEPVDSMLRMFTRMSRLNYQAAMLIPPDEIVVARMAAQLQSEIEVYGAERFTRVLIQALALPHKLVFRDDDMPGIAPYTCIVVREFASLTPKE